VNPRLTLAGAIATVLASIALYPLISSGGWFWAGIGAVIVVTAAGAATRLRRIPAAVCFLATLVVEFLYLNLVFAHHWSWGGLVPTDASLQHLSRLVTQASSEMSRYAPPVPGFRGITLLITAGIGLVSALTDLLAVRLRRPALAGLPLLVLFCVPLTTDSQSNWVGTTLVFSAGTAGYLGLLSSDGRDRLRLWGRLVRPWRDDPEGAAPDTRQLASAGRRIGTAAVVVALFVPLLLPGLKAHRLFPGSGTAVSHSYHGPISFPDPIDQLTQQLHESTPKTVLTYRTPVPNPPYLQVYVLGRLGTHAWTLAPPTSTKAVGKGLLPPVPGMAGTTPGPTVRETIHLGGQLASGKTSLEYLPLPYAPRYVDIHGSWRVDPGSLAVISAGVKLAGLGYTVTAKDVNPTVVQLREAALPPASLDGYLHYPAVFQRLARLADRITAGRTTAYGKAVALQDWFTQSGLFRYSLKVPVVHRPGALIQFLTRSRRGYCQQFAFAMAVLARLLRIPSRVVVGYTQGTYLGNDTWQVMTSDAHAWPELYFAGAGWLRFEPTPAGSQGQPGQATASAPAYTIPPPVLPQAQQTPSTPQQGSTAQPTAVPGKNGALTKLGHLDRGGAAGKRAHANTLPITLIVIAVLALLLIAPRTARSVIRSRRWWKARSDAARAHVAWLELRDDLADYRISPRASESPRALGGRLAETVVISDATREALRRVTAAEERATYAISPADSASLRADVSTVRRAVARGSARPVRWSALLLPQSVLAPVQAALQQVLDIFGWLDMLTSRARDRAASSGRAATSSVPG
jgi:TgpA N-terminal domain/Transglutaminase-like superfamily